MRLRKLGEVKKECKKLEKELKKLYRWMHNQGVRYARAKLKAHPLEVIERLHHVLITFPEGSLILEKKEVAEVFKQHELCRKGVKKLFKKKAWHWHPGLAFRDYVAVLCSPSSYLYSDTKILRMLAGVIVRSWHIERV